MPREVFISYCSQDATAAEEVREALESRGIACWIAPRDIVGGQTWAASIVGAIEECRILLVIVSGHANKSRQMSREVELADARKRRILPVRIEDVPPAKDLEYFVGNRQWTDIFPEPVHKHGDALAKAVKALCDSETTGMDSTATPVKAREDHKHPQPLPFSAPVQTSSRMRWLVGGLGGVIVALAVVAYMMWMKSRDSYLEFMTEADQYAHAEMWLDAINWYDMALAKNPPGAAQGQIYNLRCHANLHAGMVDEALSDCRRAIQITPNSYKAHLDTGEVLQALHQNDKAIKEFEAALSIATTANDIACCVWILA